MDFFSVCWKRRRIAELESELEQQVFYFYFVEILQLLIPRTQLRMAHAILRVEETLTVTIVEVEKKTARNEKNIPVSVIHDFHISMAESSFKFVRHKSYSQWTVNDFTTINDVETVSVTQSGM